MGVNTNSVRPYKNSCTGNSPVYYGSMKHTDIIAKFGGIRPLAKALGHQHPTTVAAWSKKGIPSWRRHEVLEAARKRRLGLKVEDFQ